MKRTLTLGLAAAVWLIGSEATHSEMIFSAAGNIQAEVAAFQNALGTLNPNVAGSFGSGRREINWDGVPDALSAPNNLPPEFLQRQLAARGCVCRAGIGFQGKRKPRRWRAARVQRDQCDVSEFIHDLQRATAVHRDRAATLWTFIFLFRAARPRP